MTWLFLLLGFGFFYAVTHAKSHAPRSRGSTDIVPSVQFRKKARQVAKPRQGSATRQQTESGIVYLVTSDRLNSAKIGISSNSNNHDRVQDHLKNGWNLCEVWFFKSLQDAENVEASVIAWWRNVLNLRPSCSASDMPQGGYTETVSLSRLGVKKITAFVEEVSQRTNGQKAIDTPIKKLIPGITTRVSGNLAHITEGGDRTVKNAGIWIRAYDWQRWVLEDESAHLLVEIKKTNSVPMRRLKIGSRIEVTGRIEKVGKTFRMTNPVFQVIEIGNTRTAPRKEISNIGIQTPQKRSSPSKRQSTSEVNRANSKPEKSQDIVEIHSQSVEKRDFVRARAEHCSACGALVPNGASHDCK